MPTLTINWVSAGSIEQDESLVDEIVDFAMKWLDGYDGDCSADLSTNPYADQDKGN